MNQTQFFRTLTVTDAAGNPQALRYSFKTGHYLSADGSNTRIETSPPETAPYVVVRRGNAPRPETRSHRGDSIFQVPLDWYVRQLPLSSERTPDAAPALALWRKLLTADAAITEADLGYIFINLTLSTFLEPQENAATGGLLGRVGWLERVQMHAV